MNTLITVKLAGFLKQCMYVILSLLEKYHLS